MTNFKSCSIFTVNLILVTLIPGCASGIGSQGFLENRVSRLVDEAIKSEKRQDKAIKELYALGNRAVPYLVGHLNDVRPLAKEKISFENSTADAFEGLRHYSPDTVHDALSAILNQITGENFVFVYNGGTPQEREDNRGKWIDWCRMKFPAQATTCSGE